MSEPSRLVQDTLDLLILKIPDLEPRSGWAIGQRLKQASNDALQVSDGSLYAALHKLEQQGLALGAAPRDVRWVVVRGAVGLAGAGVAIGLLASRPVSNLLRNLLVDVAPFDVPTLIGVTSLLLAVAAAAAWFLAQRAAGTDPLAALRTE